MRKEENEMLICAACGKSLPNVVQTTVIKYPGCSDCSSDDIKRALEILLGVKVEDGRTTIRESARVISRTEGAETDRGSDILIMSSVSTGRRQVSRQDSPFTSELTE
jgi:hypothetical protein